MPPTIGLAAGKERISHPFARDVAGAIVDGGGIAPTMVDDEKSHVLGNTVCSHMLEKSEPFLGSVAILDDQNSDEALVN